MFAPKYTYNTHLGCRGQ